MPCATTSPEPREISTSSPTKSTSSRSTVVLALGSNLGDRGWNLRRALHALRAVVHIVRVSTIHETEAVDAPEGSPPFFNLVLVGTTSLSPISLLHAILAIETRLGRVRRGVRNEPRIIDIDLILHGATRMRTRELTLPHPRAWEREFVMGPLRELGDPSSAFGTFSPLCGAKATQISRIASFSSLLPSLRGEGAEGG